MTTLTKPVVRQIEREGLSFRASVEGVEIREKGRRGWVGPVAWGALRDLAYKIEAERSRQNGRPRRVARTVLMVALTLVLPAAACDRNPAIMVTNAEDAVGYCAWTRGGAQLGLIWIAQDPAGSEAAAALDVAADAFAATDTTSVLASDSGTPWAERFYAWQDRKDAFMMQYVARMSPAEKGQAWAEQVRLGINPVRDGVQLRRPTRRLSDVIVRRCASES